MSRDSATTMNSLIDAADILEGELLSDQAWLSSVALMEANGFNALNIMEFDRQSMQPLWFRSSMNPLWLADYLEQDFMALDPVLLAAFNGQTEVQVSEGKILGDGEISTQRKSFIDQLISWEYGSLDAQIFEVAGQLSFKGVLVSRADGEQKIDTQHRLICAVISAAVSAPRSFDSPGATILPANLLSPREIDVLSFLASGLRNDAIAWKMNIAEVTVRIHLASARRKLGAATREEVVALAIRSGQLPL
ncbi:LuxR C-terminal-related transcriptional regulator [Loktanella sp. 5RATIMAR09]|uniref:response regulator transcription factor n=1 Tax=Loktanella sp. 5RATIMAR09 TaxID=1225655 RepID=UPI0006EB4C14|nr:LuxR C-terminal-related transcriptional regulator [Loktanella sp. 5RATIMAR09]